MIRPLFARHPELAGIVPHVVLASCPTPVERFRVAGTDIRVKRDDLSAVAYGGNKVRKLEFLLGEALEQDAAETLTFGAAGSNHALATAVYARALGLRPISLLGGQPNASYVRRNLLAQRALGADLRMLREGEDRDRAAVMVLRERERLTGKRPYVVPVGGTSPLGTLGFVNAALELAGQVADGELPVPDRLYVPLGSMGTAAGLILGLSIAGLPTRVVAVRVTPAEWVDAAKLAALITDTATYMGSAGADVSDVPADAYDVRDDAFGEEYARFTPEGMAAVAAAAEAGLRLEGTYTGKTMAALLADARAGLLDGAEVLFWDTYNSRPLAQGTGIADIDSVPADFRRFFAEPLQPLDA